jgi:glutamate-1-semialdehyde 2,1-aminomutase
MQQEWVYQPPRLAYVDPARMRSDFEADLETIDALIAQAESDFMDRMRRSRALTEEARGALAGGVASNWQAARPTPVWIDRAKGSRVWDVDGTEYVDFHGGFGATLVGHAHPAIIRAVNAQIERGSHFSQPTADLIPVTQNLAARFGMPLWRFTSTGTEATLDAVHLMRQFTKRRKILKVEGSYHGHHDSVQVSVYPGRTEAGPPERPRSIPAGAFLPQELANFTVVVPFGDLDAIEWALRSHKNEIAGMILEPVMMGIGVVSPPKGYLEGACRLLHAHGALLTLDEVKTGFALGPGGATATLDEKPDLVCLAKALGGGLPCGAIGGTEEVMDLIVKNAYEQVGTFNGNPLTMAAVRATLEEVLTPDAYRHLDALRWIMVDGCEEVLHKYEIQGHVLALGAKGCIVFSPKPLRNYRDFTEYDDRWGHAHWLYQHNGGVFLPPWGKCEQWMLSVQHTTSDVQRFIHNLETFARALRLGG